MNVIRRIEPGEAIIVLLVLAPSLVALPQLLDPWPQAYSDWLRFGGKLAGVLGLASLLFAGILAVRVPGFDQPFGGLTRLWRLHHSLGTAALLLLMLHPLLLAFAAVPGGVQAAAMTLFPPAGDVATWIGWAALLAMMIFLAPSYSFFGAPDYQRWKHLHLLAGAALLLGAIHGIALNTVLVGHWNIVTWGGLSVLALAAFSWRAVVSRKFGRKPYRVTAVEPLAKGVVELVLEPVGDRITHAAGQFVYFTPRDPALAAGCNEEHPYTISSAPQSDELRIAIKDFGDASHALQSVTPGTIAHVDGPYGRFFRAGTAEKKREPELWLGGGIGITPFVGRARALLHEPGSVDICLVYLAQDASRAYFLDELQAIASRVEGFDVITHYFAVQGPLNEAFLARHVPGFAERTAYICGPPPMIRLGRQILRNKGLPAHRVRSEEFTLL
ncbi:MAG: ferric reductase-like transmembrane domain-containing protein [Gammaproteobacteria bacterium]|nr:ferric reductase-like transmembrane domain-containing protein [Gammaproteobacteria bacterium]